VVYLQNNNPVCCRNVAVIYSQYNAKNFVNEANCKKALTTIWRLAFIIRKYLLNKDVHFVYSNYLIQFCRHYCWNL